MKGGKLMLKSIIGENAGKVWLALSKKSHLSINVLKNNTGLDDQDLNRAIGWLARENKVRIADTGTKIVYELAGR